MVLKSLLRQCNYVDALIMTSKLVSNLDYQGTIPYLIILTIKNNTHALLSSFSRDATYGFARGLYVISLLSQAPTAMARVKLGSGVELQKPNTREPDITILRIRQPLRKLLKFLVGCGFNSCRNFLLNLRIIYFLKAFEVLFRNKHVAIFSFFHLLISTHRPHVAEHPTAGQPT